MYTYAEQVVDPWYNSVIREKHEPGGEIVHPHDTGYKYLLSHAESMLDLLRNFVDAPWVRQMDLASLVRLDKTFIQHDFRKKEADLIYQLRLNGETPHWLLLVEMQSSVDRMMPYRLLLYMTEMWRDHHRQMNRHGEAAASFPQIIPIVLYNGRRPWTTSTTFQGMLHDFPYAVDPRLLDFEYILIDITRYNRFELLQQDSLMAAIFMMEQSRQQQEIIQNLHLLAEKIRGWEVSRYRLFSRWVAAFIGSDLPEAERHHVVELLDQTDPEEVELMISNVERVMKEAYKKQRFEGKLEGKLEGKIEIARNMLQHGESMERIKQMTGLTDEQLASIQLH